MLKKTTKKAAVDNAPIPEGVVVAKKPKHCPCVSPDCQLAHYKGAVVEAESLLNVEDKIAVEAIDVQIPPTKTRWGENYAGGKVPSLMILTGVQKSGLGDKSVNLKLLSYKNGEVQDIHVPTDFKLKVLSGTMKAKLLEKYKERLDAIKVENTTEGGVEAKKMPAWEVVLRTFNPKINRPRRTSLHTLAFMCGYDDPKVLAKELEKSGKVLAYTCPDVRCIITYLKELRSKPGMIDTADSAIWTKAPDFCDKHPFDKIKGFKRFANGGTWSGGSYGKGKFIAQSSGMSVPYEPDDFPYAKEVIKNLRDFGYTPPITEEDLDNNFARFQTK